MLHSYIDGRYEERHARILDARYQLRYLTCAGRSWDRRRPKGPRPMTADVTRFAFVQIDRAHPDSKDASVSTKGHEPRISSARLESEDAVQAFIRDNAPEMLTSDTREYVISDEPGYGKKVILSARDARGYYGQCYVQRYYFERD